MKKILTYILSAVLCLQLAGCSSAGGISTFTAAVEKMPGNFDPQIASAQEDLLVINNVFDGLFEIIDGEVVNNLAETVNISADGKTYTITIRQDSVFHCRGTHKKDFSGRAVTAQDFVFAINRVLNPETHSPYREDFSNVLSITAEKPDVLCIRLKNPDYNFTEKLAMPAAFPCNEEFFYKTGGAYGLTVDNILSNGPFMLNYLDKEGGNATIIRMTDSEKSVERIRLKQVEGTMQPESYINNEISGYFSFASQETMLSETSTLSFDSGNISLLFNLNHPLLQNNNIRQALGWYAFGFENSGANMAAVNSCRTIFPGTITLAGEYLKEVMPEYRPRYLDRQPKTLLQTGLSELGAARLDSISILMPSDSIYTIIYENINQLWQKNLGQFFTIEYLPTAHIRQRVDAGDFDMAFLPLTPANSTAYGIMDRFTPYSTTLNETVSTAKSMADQSKATELISQAHNIILERAMAVPMGSEQTTFYYRSYFTDLYTDPFTNVINLKYATVK